jgi:hypothetical protein
LSQKALFAADDFEIGFQEKIALWLLNFYFVGTDQISVMYFDDNLIFNNCTQSGKFVNSQANFNIPEKLIEQYESRINSLEKELDFLREILRKK